MPVVESKRHILPLKVLAQQNIAIRRAEDVDLAFLKCVTGDEACPEYGGFNTKLAREQGQSIKPASKTMYTPLIDMKPSDPDTMMTAMVQAQNLTIQTGQVYIQYSQPINNSTGSWSM